MANQISFAFSLGATLAGSFRGATSSANKQIAGLAAGVRNLERTPVGRLGASFEASRAKLSKLGTELRTAQAQLAALKARADASGGASGTLARQIANAENQVNRLTNSLKNSSNAHKQQVAAIKTEVGSVSMLTKEYKGLGVQMDKLKNKQQRLAANMAAKDANKGRRADLRGGMMNTMIAGAVLAVPVKFAIDFEDAMARVGAISRASNEDLVTLTATARQLGRDTVFSASQAAEGMQYLAMAGFSVEDTISAMPGLLGMAAAGATDLGLTADIASNILSGFKIPASEMDRVSDVLVSTFTSSNTTLETLGDTMKYVAPVAQALGISLEEAASMAGILGSAGIQGSQAGTAMRASMLRLAAPPKQAADALRKLGVSVKDSKGNMRPFVEVLKDLNKAMEGMGSAEKMQNVKHIFGMESASAMVEVMSWASQTVDKFGNDIVDSQGNVISAIDDYINKQKDAAGITARTSKQMNDTTGGSLRVMRSAMEDVAIVTGNLLSPAIRSLADGMVIGANAVSGFMERFPTLSKYVGLAAGGIIAFSLSVRGLAFSYTFLKGGLLLAQGALIRMTGAQVGATAATVRMTLAQRAFALVTMFANGAVKLVTLSVKVMSMVMRLSPIGLILSGIALAAGYIMSKWETVSGFFSGVWESISSFASSAWAVLKEYFWDKNPLVMAGRAIVGAWDGIMTYLQPVFDWLANKFAWIGDAFSALGDAWNYFFGDDDESANSKAAVVTGEAGAAQERMAQHKQASVPAYAPYDESMPLASSPTVYQPAPPAAASDYTPANYNPSAALPPDLLSGSGNTTYNMDVQVPLNIAAIQGLDEKEFVKKMENFKPKLETFVQKLIRRAIEEMEKTKLRTAFAQ